MTKDKAEYHSTSKNIEVLKCEVKTLTDEANQLRQQVHRLKLEKEALEIAAKLIKKD
jgi:putative transposase